MKSTSFRSQVYELFSSMRFAVSLLTLLGIASIIGTVLKQNEPYNNYLFEFGPFWFSLFEKLGLYDVYHSSWFLVILLFLLVSTSLCIYRNSPQMLKDMRAWRERATEASLSSFSLSHRYSTSAETLNLSEQQQQLVEFLHQRRFKTKVTPHESGGTMITAKSGAYQRLGYIFTHVAIVIICLGGLLDGNVPFKLQELLGQKTIETADIPASQVPVKSRMSPENLSFRGNMTLSEGSQGNVAFIRMRDGYLVQELPFTVALTDFRIQHYPTGQPKSFESDLVITDKTLKVPIKQTIRVNHPLTYKGVTIYQSDFQDGGSKLSLAAWPLFSENFASHQVNAVVFEQTPIGQGEQALSLEMNDFRLFNILNLSADGKGKPHNVGPSMTFKLRDGAGQAREYVVYMQPLMLDGRSYYVSGMRATPQEEFKYLRIPVDNDGKIDGFMRLRSTLFNPALDETIAQRLTEQAIGQAGNMQLRNQFHTGVIRLLQAFRKQGFSEIARVIEGSVPEKEREKAAQAYIKIFNSAVYEAWLLSQSQLSSNTAGSTKMDETTLSHYLQDSINSMSDMFFFGSPYFFQLESFEHKEASGLQVTRSPGKDWVYAGSILLVIGIFFMMYVRDTRIWLLLKRDSVLFAMSSNRKTREIDEDFVRYQAQLSQLLKVA